MAEVADQLRRRIVTGDLTPGQRLPPIRRLARLHAVSVPTMHAAIQSLVAVGFVRTSHGVGTFVARPTSETAQLVHAWLHASATELALLRAAIDAATPPLVAHSAARGARVRPPRILSDVNSLAHERSILRLDLPEPFVDADFAFHGAVAAGMRGAEAAVAMLAVVSRRLRVHRLATADLEARDDELDEAHLALARAVLDGETRAAARLARTVARRELEFVRRQLG